MGTVVRCALVAFLALQPLGCTTTAGPQRGGSAGDANPNGDDRTDGADAGDNDSRADEGGPDASAKQVFAVIGDYGDDDDDTRAVADLIKGWEPDFIITTGDNDYSDGAFSGTFEGLELGVGQYFHEFIGDYQGSAGQGADENRFFPTPGDHDWGDTCDDPGGLDDYLRYFTLPSENSGNERYYDFRRGPIHFFSIHAIQGCEPDGTGADSLQAQWVREAAAASNATFKVAFLHKPPYSSGDRHVGEGVHMRWPWREWGFDLIISGDDHVYERILRDGVTYIINGLGGVDIHGFLDVPVEGSQVRFAENYGAMRVEASDDRLTAEFITIDNLVIDEFTITATRGEDESVGALDPDVPPLLEGDWYRPAVSTSWQWQLQPGDSGEIDRSHTVDVYDIDLFDVPASVISELQAAGRRVICYFSAGSFEGFRDDSGEFLPEELGRQLDDFRDERWLDIRSANVHAIMLNRLDLAVRKGCDGVEPDNVDGFVNDTGFALTPDDQLAFNRFLANSAHQRGLAVALKNDLEQIDDLLDYFDLALNEQCHEFDECDALAPFVEAGKPVFNAEYAHRFVNNGDEREAMCADSRTRGFRTLILPIDLDASFRLSCDLP
ncbi:MAG: endo alpha-1,4 polygalactosaminidase [Phycisphaerae bacterium]